MLCFLAQLRGGVEEKYCFEIETERMFKPYEYTNNPQDVLNV